MVRTQKQTISGSRARTLAAAVAVTAVAGTGFVSTNQVHAATADAATTTDKQTTATNTTIATAKHTPVESAQADVSAAQSVVDSAKLMRGHSRPIMTLQRRRKRPRKVMLMWLLPRPISPKRPSIWIPRLLRRQARPKN